MHLTAFAAQGATAYSNMYVFGDSLSDPGNDLLLTDVTGTIVGGHIGYPWTDEMIAMAWKHENVFIVADAHSPKYWPQSFVHYINTFGKDKVLFGTDYPVLDFEHLPGTAPWWAVDAVICALGSTMAQAGSREAFKRIDHDYPLTFAGQAHAHGAGTFVLNSAAGADAGSRIFYNRVKGALEQDLRGLDFDSLTLVRPGLIGGQRAHKRTGEHLALQVLGALGPLLPRGWRMNPAGNIAAALVDAALEPLPGEHVVSAAQLA